MSSPGDPRSRDPGDYLDLELPSVDEHRASVDALLDRCYQWMVKRSSAAARTRGLDGKDVLQLTLVRLLRSSHQTDLTNKGLKTWIGRRIEWAADELARQRRHDGGEAIGQEAVEARLEADAAGSATCAVEERSLDGTCLDPAALSHMGLSAQQIELILVECSDLDLSLREFAHLVGRSYAAIRKDRQRARERLEHWIGLTPAERRVFIAFRESRSAAEAAQRTGYTVSELRGLLDSAHKKVHDAFTDRWVDPDVP